MTATKIDLFIVAERPISHMSSIHVCQTGAKEDFEAAAEEAKTLDPEPADDDKLVLYGLFKQATVGDVNTSADALQLSTRRWSRACPDIEAFHQPAEKSCWLGGGGQPTASPSRW